jgi:hypothetical protein
LGFLPLREFLVTPQVAIRFAFIHLPKLAEDENVNDIKRDGVSADYGR